MTTTDRTLHLAFDRAGRTWRVLEREDGSLSVYYSVDADPTHYVVFDTLDERASEIEARLQSVIASQASALSAYEKSTNELRGRCADLEAACYSLLLHVEPGLAVAERARAILEGRA